MAEGSWDILRTEGLPREARIANSEEVGLELAKCLAHYYNPQLLYFVPQAIAPLLKSNSTTFSVYSSLASTGARPPQGARTQIRPTSALRSCCPA